MNDERPIDLTDEEVRTAQRDLMVRLRMPVAIDDSLVDADVVVLGKRQPGIPTNAANVRMCGDYLKCDAPDGSSAVSARVECPFGSWGDRLWVRETWRPDFSHDPDDTRYLADYPTDPEGIDLSRRDLHPWEPPETMPRERSRFTLRIASVGVENIGGSWHWSVVLDVAGGRSGSAIDAATLRARIMAAIERRHGEVAVFDSRMDSGGVWAAWAGFPTGSVRGFGDTVEDALESLAVAYGLREDGTDPADEVERLMRIIDGGPPPSDEEIEAHADSGGAWRAADNSSSIEIKARDVWGAQGVREADAAIGRVRRWWSLDEQRRPRERIVTFGGDR